MGTQRRWKQDKQTQLHGSDIGVNVSHDKWIYTETSYTNIAKRMYLFYVIPFAIVFRISFNSFLVYVTFSFTFSFLMPQTAVFPLSEANYIKCTFRLLWQYGLVSIWTMLCNLYTDFDKLQTPEPTIT